MAQFDLDLRRTRQETFGRGGGGGGGGVRVRRGGARAVRVVKAVKADAFSTALFTGLNLAVFLILAASVAAAAVLYGQGA